MQRKATLRKRLTILLVLSLALWTQPVLADPLTPHLVKDINPGAASGSPLKLLNVHGTLYFVATAPDTGLELWRSNGNETGTTLVRDIKAGTDGTDIREMLDISGTLFFTIQYKQGAALWKVTGPAATADQLVKLAITDTLASVYDLTNVGNTLYFFHQHSGNTGPAYELWTSDGVKAHTHLVTALPAGKRANNLVNLKGTAYFSAGDALWKSDGTAAGTVQIKPLQLGTDTAATAWPVVLNNQFYFVGNDGSDGFELFKSDGTAANTVRVANINPATGSNPTDLTVLNGKLYFSADDGTHGQELWSSNGSEAGTTFIKDINPAGSSQPHNFIVNNGVLYFAADDGVHGVELWKSDGTVGGTLLVKDILAGAPSSSPSQLTLWNNAVYFVANNATGGTDLWQSDGTEAGTTPVMAVAPTITEQGIFTPTLAAIGTELFFPGYSDANGIELWALGDCGGGCHAFLPVIKR